MGKNSNEIDYFCSCDMSIVKDVINQPWASMHIQVQNGDRNVKSFVSTKYLEDASSEIIVSPLSPLRFAKFVVISAVRRIQRNSSSIRFWPRVWNALVNLPHVGCMLNIRFSKETLAKSKCNLIKHIFVWSVSLTISLEAWFRSTTTLNTWKVGKYF
jgi:hypothetical protein